MITSKGYDDQDWTLVYEFDSVPVQLGTCLVASDGAEFRLDGGRAPHNSSSTGRVWVANADLNVVEFYPGVFGLKWVVL